MKTLLISFFIITANLTFAQDYTDTIYYKTGMIRSGQIFQETKTTIKYNYLGQNGRVLTTTARKSMLNSFTVGDESTSIASNFESKNKTSLVETGNSSRSSEVNTVAAVAGGGVVAVVASAGVGLIVTFIALVEKVF